MFRRFEGAAARFPIRTCLFFLHSHGIRSGGVFSSGLQVLRSRIGFLEGKRGKLPRKWGYVRFEDATIVMAGRTSVV